MPHPVLAAVQRLDPIDLDTVEQRAALQRRVDRKYLVPTPVWIEVVEALAADHVALEVDGDRLSRYETIYFDTPDLRTYRDHVDGERPRWKVRSRRYVGGDKSSFELKVKQEDDETVKDHLDGDDADHGNLDRARAFLGEHLRERTGEELPAGLAPSLITRFRRGTLLERDGSQRVTFDLDLELVRPDGALARLDADWVLVETKSEGGDGRCDELLAQRGIEPVAMSKYRTGIALLVTDEPQDAGTVAAERFALEGAPV
ncbi:MAG TPA: polyphosphate polymerase domain-containing protein [Capillimicrobium sp.]|nr:polyphosphate polymerase domain-containing protein [Capillimicrobium sp.]